MIYKYNRLYILFPPMQLGSGKWQLGYEFWQVSQVHSIMLIPFFLNFSIAFSMFPALDEPTAFEI